MTDDDLKKILKKLPIPASTESARGRAWHQANVAFQAAPAEAKRASATGMHMLRWASGVACLAVTCLAAAWIFFDLSGKDADDFTRTLQEMEMLFPDRLNAVIERDGEYQIDVSEGNSGVDVQPVIVEFKRGSQTVRVLSFSGRRVCVDLGEKETCFEPLVTGEGEVILAGENFLWSPKAPSRLNGFIVTARQLDSAS
ncbi:MAG: hypothetical protein ACK5NG_08265 [Chthoniobacterales bacterium]